MATRRPSGRATSVQCTYLRRLLSEAFPHLYDYTAVCGRIEANLLHTMASDEASRAIRHLIDARARGWTPWSSTPEAQAKAASESQRSTAIRARVEILRALMAQGHLCNCAEQRLEVEQADESLCPLHSRFNAELTHQHPTPT